MTQITLADGTFSTFSIVSVSLPTPMVAQLDQWAIDEGCNRSAFVRRLLCTYEQYRAGKKPTTKRKPKHD